MPFFSKVFKSKDGQIKKTTAPAANGVAHKKPQWSDAWVRTRVDPEEVGELLHVCTAELKSRGQKVTRKPHSPFAHYGHSARRPVPPSTFSTLVGPLRGQNIRAQLFCAPARPGAFAWLCPAK